MIFWKIVLITWLKIYFLLYFTKRKNKPMDEPQVRDELDRKDVISL